MVLHAHPKRLPDWANSSRIGWWRRHMLQWYRARLSGEFFKISMYSILGLKGSIELYNAFPDAKGHLKSLMRGSTWMVWWMTLLLLYLSFMHCVFFAQGWWEVGSQSQELLFHRRS